MIRVSVLYPTKEGSKFDWDYYTKTHMPLVRERFAGALVKDEIDRGLGTAEPGAPAPFQVVAHLSFNSMDDVQKAMGAHGPELMADIPNYTDMQPLFQISEVAVS